MRKIIAALAACLVLTGCGLGRWEGEIRFTRKDGTPY